MENKQKTGFKEPVVIVSTPSVESSSSEVGNCVSERNLHTKSPILKPLIRFDNNYKDKFDSSIIKQNLYDTVIVEDIIDEMKYPDVFALKEKNNKIPSMAEIGEATLLFGDKETRKKVNMFEAKDDTDEDDEMGDYNEYPRQRYEPNKIDPDSSKFIKFNLENLANRNTTDLNNNNNINIARKIQLNPASLISENRLGKRPSLVFDSLAYYDQDPIRIKPALSGLLEIF